jgi:hypothetical protein
MRTRLSRRTAVFDHVAAATTAAALVFVGAIVLGLL